MDPITWTRAIDALFTYVLWICESCTTALVSTSVTGTAPCSTSHVQLASPRRLTGWKSALELKVRIKEKSLMATFPEQPLPRGAAPPIVYVSEKTVWQYKQITRDLAQSNIPNEDELNELGKDGWELVSAFNCANRLYIYFKRIKP
jgi:hypothetical protein